MSETDGGAGEWKLETDSGQVAWLTLDATGSSTNVLSQGTLRELDRLLQELSGQSLKGLVVRSGKSSGFIAGANIREFPSLDSAGQAQQLVRAGQQTFDRLEALPFPTVALLNGFALGGGLELALACRYRVALGDSRLSLGLPEVQLGLHPGFGGTVRAVRLLGVRSAMSLMLTGRPVRAEQALALGLVDRLVSDAQQLESAARELIASAPPPRRPRLLERALSWPGVRALVRPSILRQVAGRARPEHYPAPYAIIELWSRYGARGKAAYEAEAQSFARLVQGDSARGLIRVFLLQDRLKGLAGRNRAALERVHVVGAGVMGGDIAAWCALRGLKVTLQDRESKFVEPALKRAHALFEKRLSDPTERNEAIGRLTSDVAGAGAAEADVVIEAIFEDLDAKRALYAAAEPLMRPTAVLATNTSSLTLETLNSTLRDPGRFVGLHFFNPVPQMPLVEIVHSEATRPDILQSALAFARRIDKLPLPCRSSPGFLVNRVLFPYLHEAMHAASEGISFNAIDKAAVDFGMPMGPMELCDVVGLDVVLHVGEIVTRELRREPPAFTEKLRRLVQGGQLGRKSGQGLFRWQDGKIRRDDSPMPPPADLTDRLVLVLVNECVACAREGIVADTDLIDAGVIFGTGFAPFRGGPIHYARTRGIKACLSRMRELELRYGPRFQADAGWAQLQPSGGPNA